MASITDGCVYQVGYCAFQSVESAVQTTGIFCLEDLSELA